MSELLFHPSTRNQFKALAQSTPHALIVAGQVGSGKQTLAENFIHEALSIKSTINQAYVLVINPYNSSIGIEEVRKVINFLNRKTTGRSRLRRAVLINDAHTMTGEAQNALLKSLEEPPADTLLVLTADDITNLKPTIRSRSQTLTILPVDLSAATQYFEKSGHSEQSINQAYYMSGGRVGLLCAILNDATEHELIGAIEKAKAIITMTIYERLLLVDNLSKQKEQAHQLLVGLECISLSGMRHAADNQNQVLTKKFHDISSQAVSVRDKLKKNANAKAVLTELFIQL